MSEVVPSKKVQQIEASPTLALVAKAKELVAEGKDVISLSVGEPDWPTLNVAKKAGVEAINNDFTKYTPATGIAPLRQAIADQTNADFKTKYDINNVAVATGGKFVIYSLLYSILNSGDEVLMPTPFWVSYPAIVGICEAKTIAIKTNKSEQFKLTPELLEKHISDKSRVLILNSPSNPSGFLYSQKELNALAVVIKKYPKLLVLSDDIYNRLTFDYDVAPHLLNSNVDISKQIFIVNGVSKSYSMTGWRIGWAIGDKAIIKAMGAFQSQTTSSTVSVSQKAALAAITEGREELLEVKKLLKSRRDFVLPLLNSIEGVSVSQPDGAFYMWADVSECFGKSFKDTKIKGSEDFAKLLLENHSVVVVPGKPFGEDDYIRISYAVKEERMKEAINRLSSFIKSLNKESLFSI